MFKTLKYTRGTKEEEIKVGKEYLFGQIWDRIGDGEAILESGSMIAGDDTIIEFEIVQDDDDNILDTVIEITGIS